MVVTALLIFDRPKSGAVVACSMCFRRGDAISTYVHDTFSRFSIIFVLTKSGRDRQLYHPLQLPKSMRNATAAVICLCLLLVRDCHRLASKYLWVVLRTVSSEARDTRTAVRTARSDSRRNGQHFSHRLDGTSMTWTVIWLSYLFISWHTKHHLKFSNIFRSQFANQRHGESKRCSSADTRSLSTISLPVYDNSASPARCRVKLTQEDVVCFYVLTRHLN